MGTIICAVDDSAGGRDALEAARRLSGELGLRLVLAHVARRTRPSPGLAHISDAQARNLADVLIERLCREHGLGEFVERRVEVGDCATELARIASEESASMLVIGSRGSRALRRGAVGDLASELGCNASCPVVVVAPGRASRLSPSRANR